MQLKLNPLWLLLIVSSALFCLLYLWFTLFPGRVIPEAWQYFSTEQITNGRDYNRTQQLLFISGFILKALFLGWFVFSGKAVAVSKYLERLTGSYHWSLLIFFILIWLLLKVINLPLTLYGSYFFQHRWGFSTQSLGFWWLDYFKGSVLDLILSMAGFIILFWSFARWPRTWWLACAVLISFWLLIQSFLWPVLISPLFNRFEPATDPAIINMVQNISQKAGLEIEQVLVMDASRRTTKANAYFTGLGHTKRIVLYDNLLNNYSLDEVEAVIAHEMAHWKQGHIVQGLLWGIVLTFMLWLVLFLLLKQAVPLNTRFPPFVWPLILLYFLLVSFVGSPAENYISRSMEKEADQVAVKLTENEAAAIRLQKNLSVKNTSDVSPPAFIRWFSYSHPPVIERINNIKQIK
jgi:STE24 endopeptidase